MLRFSAIVMALGLMSFGWAASSSTAKKTTSKKSGARTAPKKTASKPAAKSATKSASKTGARRASTSRSSVGRTTKSWRSRQMQPTADRYKQIQAALAAKGYLHSEDATGVWGPNSVDALKRFQDDQKIAGSGKINSLSLIALGLGPKHESVASAKPPAPPPPPGQ